MSSWGYRMHANTPRRLPHRSGLEALRRAYIITHQAGFCGEPRCVPRTCSAYGRPVCGSSNVTTEPDSIAICVAVNPERWMDVERCQPRLALPGGAARRRLRGRVAASLATSAPRGRCPAAHPFRSVALTSRRSSGVYELRTRLAFRLKSHVPRQSYGQHHRQRTTRSCVVERFTDAGAYTSASPTASFRRPFRPGSPSLQSRALQSRPPVAGPPRRAIAASPSSIPFRSAHPTGDLPLAPTGGRRPRGDGPAAMAKTGCRVVRHRVAVDRAVRRRHPPQQIHPHGATRPCPVPRRGNAMQEGWHEPSPLVSARQPLHSSSAKFVELPCGSWWRPTGGATRLGV